MSTEFISHRRQKLVGEVGFAPRTESLVKSARENGRRYGFVDRGFDRPTSFAGIGNSTGKLRKIWVLKQGVSRQIQQPGCDYASATPHFRDVTQVQVVLVVLRIAQRSGFSIYFAVSPVADVGAARIANPSAYAAIIPYSIPLWTILTKWPAPFGPQCR